MRTPTVKVISGKGFATINKSDFDSAKHKLFHDCPPVKPAHKAGATAAGPSALPVRTEIESAVDVAALKLIAKRLGFFLHPATKKLETAKAKLIEQIDEPEPKE